MRTHFRTVAAALALAAIAGPASAQTVTGDPLETRPVITQRPLTLTPAQRTTVYRTIVPRGKNQAPVVHERIVTETIGRAPPVASERVVREPAVRYVIGDRVPAEAELAPVPESVVAEVPSVSGYQYMVINGRLLLVDPVTSTVVAEVHD